MEMRFIRGWRCTALLSTLLAFGAIGQTTGLSSARAADSSRAIGEILGEIDWGDTKSTVLDKLKSRRLEKLRNKDELRRNRVEMQRARKRLMDQFELIRESYTELEGGDTGYEVSVIGREFEKDNNEALIKIRDEVAQRFFIFLDGELYRMIVAYNRNYIDDIDFDDFVRQAGDKYGEPVSTESAEIAGEERIAYAKWQDEKTILEVKNKKEFFGTYLMTFSDRKRIESLDNKTSQFEGIKKPNEDASKRVEKLSVDSKADSKEGVVNDMIGESVKVDLSRDKDTSLEKQGPTAKTRDKSKGAQKQAEASQAGEQTSEESEESEQTQEQETSEQQDRDFSDVTSDEAEDEDKEDDGGVIVY